MGQELPISARQRVTNGREAIAFFEPLLPHAAETERLVVAFLDETGFVLGHFEHVGDPGGVDLPIRQVIARALIHDARAILLAHNHPSGDPTPSAIDIEVTRQLATALRPLGIVLHDHLIRAQDKWRSLVAMELI